MRKVDEILALSKSKKFQLASFCMKATLMLFASPIGLKKQKKYFTMPTFSLIRLNPPLLKQNLALGRLGILLFIYISLSLG